jgi:hypothetical protein
MEFVVLKLYPGHFTVFGRIGNGVEGNDSVMGRRSWEDGKRRCNLLWCTSDPMDQASIEGTR